MSPAKKAELVAFCRRQLADGPVLSDDFYAALEREICSRKTFDGGSGRPRHKRALGIRSRHDGYSGKWYIEFELPPAKIEIQLQAYLDLGGAGREESIPSKRQKAPRLGSIPHGPWCRCGSQCWEPDRSERNPLRWGLHCVPCGREPKAIQQDPNNRRRLCELFWRAEQAQGRAVPTDGSDRPYRGAGALKQTRWFGTGTVAP
jgi:hypothetical protein